MVKKMVVKRQLLESSLSRIRQTMLKHDTGFISANRHEYSRVENQERNEALLIDLQRLYDVTSVKGGYIEDYDKPTAIEVGENSFFVSEPDNDKYIRKYSISLKDKLAEFGKKYEQDSVLYVPKGGAEGIIIGTKEGVFPGLGQESRLSYPVFGKSGNFVTRVKGRPFVFKNEAIIQEHKCDGPGNWISNFARHLRTDKYNRKK